MTNTEIVTVTGTAVVDEISTLETEIPDADAQVEIAEAATARHSIARNHVRRLRRRRPDASPADIIETLERQYISAITAAGTAIAVGGFAASAAISLIPLGGVASSSAKTATTQVAKRVATEAAKKAAADAAKASLKQAGKGLALGAAKSGAERMTALLPAGEQQLQFEITAVFSLAIADVHGLQYDRDQAHALIYGLTNERINQQQIAKMASDVATTSAAGQSDSAGGGGAKWAATLADALPGDSAKRLVRTMQTGQLDAVHDTMTGKQQAAVDYGVRAVTGGVTRFVFGRDVVKSARQAFPEAPEIFPPHLTVLPNDDEDAAAPNRAVAALENAAKSTGGRIAGAAGTATRVFRSVDLDGDGIPDEPQALTAVKGAGGAVAGAAGAVGGRVGGLFKRSKREADLSKDRAGEAPGADIAESIAKLAALRDQGILTEEEFTAKKTELLTRI